MVPIYMDLTFPQELFARWLFFFIIFPLFMKKDIHMLCQETYDIKTKVFMLCTCSAFIYLTLNTIGSGLFHCNT